jgi:hypothetical protein
MMGQMMIPPNAQNTTNMQNQLNGGGLPSGKKPSGNVPIPGVLPNSSAATIV